MTGGSYSVPPPIAGRAEELRVLDRAVERAAVGEPSAVFVHGEAGVGKTRLAQEVATLSRKRGCQVLWGRCLRFGAVESVLLPWVVALEGRLAELDPEERLGIVDGVPGAAALLPSLGGGVNDGSTQLVSVVEALFARVSARSPTVLVMDDVQWADSASRDALSYLVAGFGRQAQLVVATYRDEGLPDGDPMFGWMADLRRLPRVSELSLGRLAPAETRVQLEHLLGTPPTRGLVDDVHRRSGGNPYLSELLTQGVGPDADGLPPGLPGDLSAALLAAWHRLAATTREVVRVLAVAGRPTSGDLLVDVCVAVGHDARDVRRGLTEAAAAGTVVRADADALWLRHPLLAEVLYATYLPGEAAPVHRAWAERLACAARPESPAEELRRLGDLALHHERAGGLDDAFRVSVAAADLARAQRSWRDEPVHLERATFLWPQVSRECRAGHGETELLERAAVACARVGQYLSSLSLARRALELARQSDDRRMTSRLVRLCESTAWWLGERSDEPVAAAREALDLVRALPDSREFAEAQTELAGSLAWEGRYRQAGPVADEAVAAARRSGSVEALAEALGVRSMARPHDGTSEADSIEALELAVESGDPGQIQWCSQWRVNRLLDTGRLREAAQLSGWALSVAQESGALGAVIWHAATLARLLADEGRLREAAGALRTGLSLTGVGNGAAALRLAAVVTSVRSGDLVAAALHRERAFEQIPTLERRPGLEAPPMLAELMLAEGRPQEALGLLFLTMGHQSIDPRVTDLMTVWGVRAAADLAQAGRDRGDKHGVRRARSLLNRLVKTRDRLPGQPFVGDVTGDPVLTAWRALRDAEVTRFGSEPAPDAWRNAVRHCELAGLGWEAQRSNLRLAQALLADGAARADVAQPLRTAHRYAVAEEAEGLRREVESLAASARISLSDPEAPVIPSQGRAERSPLEGLTPREQEVLGHLVAGRTYAEIARALYISDKTVSAHVSNLLRKTGTASRHEVSALVLRLRETEAAAPA